MDTTLGQGTARSIKNCLEPAKDSDTNPRAASRNSEESDKHQVQDNCADCGGNEDDRGHEVSSHAVREGRRYHACGVDDSQTIEDFEQYRPGGHHSVVLGDFLGEENRFQVWHKLDQGSSGLVWLCRDLAFGKLCAVKVLRHEISKQSHKLPEIGIEEMLGAVPTEEAWDIHIVMPLETSIQHGPTGEHLCIIMPFLGPPVIESRTFNWNKVPLLKDICFQLVEGMSFMHSRGLCHGDFHPSNILFKTKLRDLTEFEMARYLPEPQSHEVVTVEERPGESRCGPHAPQYAIGPLLLTLEDEYITKEIAVINFGVAFEVENSIKPSVIPDKYAPPERQRELGSLPSIGSDTWALGCTITEVLCGTTPFEVSDKFSFE